MDLEYCVVLYHGTWDLVPCLTNANISLGKRVLTLKYHPNGIVAPHKALISSHKICACSYH